MSKRGRADQKSCDSHLRPVVTATLNTEMRKGEVPGLKWENVHLNQGFLHIKKTKNGKRKEAPVEETLKQTSKGLPRRLDGGHVFHGPKTYSHLSPTHNVKAFDVLDTVLNNNNCSTSQSGGGL
jgi:integrase